MAPGQSPQATTPDYDFEIVFANGRSQGVADWWRGMFTVLVLSAGVAGFLRQRATAVLLIAPVIVLLGNLGLHLVWGREFYLYGLHWSASLAWLTAGVRYLPGRWRPAGGLLLGAFVITCALNSALLLHMLLDVMRGS